MRSTSTNVISIGQRVHKRTLNRAQLQVVSYVIDVEEVMLHPPVNSKTLSAICAKDAYRPFAAPN